MANPARAAEPAPPIPPGAFAHQIEQTEQAFVQAAGQVGVAQAFRRYAAPGAILFLPDPVPAAPILRVARWPGELVWRPHAIGVAASGDLAFSAGPSLLKTPGRAAGGLYLTVWRRAPGGAWQFVVSHGVDMPASAFDPPAQPPTVLALDPAARPDPSEGLREADAALDADLSRQAPSPFASRLDEQVLVERANRPLAVGKRKALKLLADGPPIREAQLLHGEVSLDGTLGYVYGRMRWATPLGPQLGYYVRVWRNAGQGWRLLVDQTAER